MLTVGFVGPTIESKSQVCRYLVVTSQLGIQPDGQPQSDHAATLRGTVARKIMEYAVVLFVVEIIDI